MRAILSWFTGAHQVPLSLAQRWGIAAGGVLTERNRGGFDELRFAWGRRESRDCLREGWSVHDSQTLKKIHAWLVAEGHRVSCFRLLERVAAIQGGNAPYDPASPSAPLYQWASDHSAQIHRTGLIAWDFCRLINVARWGYTAGYLDESTAWAWIMQAATAVRSTCSSWQDVADDFRTGFEYWNQGKPPPRSFQADIERLLDSPHSPWRQLPFDTPLGS